MKLFSTKIPITIPIIKAKINFVLLFINYSYFFLDFFIDCFDENFCLMFSHNFAMPRGS